MSRIAQRGGRYQRTVLDCTPQTVQCGDTRNVMDVAPPVAQLPVTAASLMPRTVALDADFDTRWAAWVARGLAHEQHVRRRFLIWVPVIVIGAAIAFALLGS